MNGVTIVLILNLLLVAVSLYYFYQLFRTGKGKPILFSWRLILIGVLIFVVETIFTMLRNLQVFNMPRVVNGIFEMIIICLFIYVVLFQRTSIMATNARENHAK